MLDLLRDRCELFGSTMNCSKIVIEPAEDLNTEGNDTDSGAGQGEWIGHLAKIGDELALDVTLHTHTDLRLVWSGICDPRIVERL